MKKTIISFLGAGIFAVLGFTACEKPAAEEPVLPVADFEFTVEEGTGNVTFTNKSAEATSYEWEFGDEKDGYSTEENPVYEYDKSGSYTVVLTAINEDGVDTVEKTVKVEIIEAKPTVNITIDGNIDDWNDIPWREDVTCGGEMQAVKVAATEDFCYVLIKGAKDLATKASKTAVGFDIDDNLETGWQACNILKDGIAGADAMQELAGFHIWGWRAEDNGGAGKVGWDWIKDGWMEWATDAVIGDNTYKEWKFDMKYARAQVIANSIFQIEGQDLSKFAQTVSRTNMKMYIWLRDAKWQYVASAPAEGGVPFNVEIGQYVEASAE